MAKIKSNNLRMATALFTLAIGASVLRQADAASSIQQGKHDAIADCSACHRVTQDQIMPPPISNPDEARSAEAPSFDVIARRYFGRRRKLIDFIDTPEHPMREQQFLPRDLKAIVDYIGSLRYNRW